MRFSPKLILCALVFVFQLYSLSLFSQVSEPELAAESEPDTGAIDKGIFRYVDLTPGLRLWGAESDFEIGFRIIDDLDTALWLRASFAYGDFGFYRNPDGSFFVPGDDFADTQYTRWNIHWGLGVQQGLHFDKSRDRNDLELLLAWIPWTDIPAPSEQIGKLGFESPMSGTGTQGVFLHNFMLDLLYDGVVFDPVHKTKHGVWLDLAGTWAPQALNQTSGADYVRVSFAARGFLPLYKQSDESTGWNSFSLYGAGYFGVDQLFDLSGDESGIPHPVSQLYGGRFYRMGTGGSLRGIIDGFFDGTTKLVGNLELRATLPALFVRDLVPIAVIYVDGSYYASPPGMSQENSNYQGFKAATGLGLMLNLFDLAEFGAYTQVVLTGTNYDGAIWNPFVLAFGLHF